MNKKMAEFLIEGVLWIVLMALALIAAWIIASFFDVIASNLGGNVGSWNFFSWIC